MFSSQECTKLIKKFEGLKLKAYLDPVGIPTIGYGTIMYKNGQRVKMGDKITEKQALDLLQWEILMKAEEVNKCTVDTFLNQNQFDALVSFAYNVGTGALKGSTLLKKALINSNDPDISAEFMKWVTANKKTLPGLVTRRTEESKLYFT